jgi:Transposase DDE domain
MDATMTSVAGAKKRMKAATGTLVGDRSGALRLAHIRQFAEVLFDDDLHAKRVESLANGVAGVLNAAMMTIHAIGQAYAAVAHIEARSGVKQIDRLLSNVGVSLDAVFPSWIRFVVGVRTELIVALDWTEFEPDDHVTLCAYAVTRHGRATPLLWKTHKKSEMEGHRTQWEHDLVEELHRAMAPNVGITLLADRGFGDQKLYELLTLLGWDFVIRFRGAILVENSKGEVRPASEWVRPGGRAFLIRGAKVTADKASVPGVVLVHARGMKEPWCLATSLASKTASEVVKLYGRRFTIEETFRDTKDIRFGLGLSSTHIGRTDRRDRLLFLFAIAHALLTLLGAASEASGLDKTLKVSTATHRTHSLYWQGTFWYRQLAFMRDDWFERLITAFDKIVREQEVFVQALGIL